MAKKYLRGALIEFTKTFPLPIPNVIVQYNPETMTHSWTPATTNPLGPDDKGDPLAISPRWSCCCFRRSRASAGWSAPSRRCSESAAACRPRRPRRYRARSSRPCCSSGDRGACSGARDEPDRHREALRRGAPQPHPRRGADRPARTDRRGAEMHPRPARNPGPHRLRLFAGAAPDPGAPTSPTPSSRSSGCSRSEDARMFSPNSRYAGLATYTVTMPDGTMVTATRLPLPNPMILAGYHRRVVGDGSISWRRAT
jgi:hypothetical protein